MAALHLSDPTLVLPFAAPGLALADWSHRPRAGAKGAGTRAWLERLGYGPVPPPNASARLADGGLIAMLGENDVLMVDHAPWMFGDGDALDAMVYPMPRVGGTAWLRLEGARGAELLACLTGVDLRARSFPELAVAQTLVAQVTAIIIRDDRGGALGYHIFFDITYTGYIVNALLRTAGMLGGTGP